MPPSSRKRNKGQARKAKAAAAAAAANANNLEQRIMQISNGCDHGQPLNTTPGICSAFLTVYFQNYLSFSGFNNIENISTLVQVVRRSLDVAYCKFPQVLHNEMHREIVKKNIICQGASAIIQFDRNPNSKVEFGFAVALMLIDSYAPSCPIPSGNFDERDAKKWLRNSDIISGCQRSLVKYFVNQISCNCLDGIYSRIKCNLKMGKCFGCKQNKERTSLYICTGCERVMYCSKACQLSHVPFHKSYCKQWQRYDCTHG